MFSLSDRPNNELVREFLDIDLDGEVEWRDQYSKCLPEILFTQQFPMPSRAGKSCRVPGGYRGGFYDFRISLFEGRMRWIQCFKDSLSSRFYRSYIFRDHDDWLKIGFFHDYALQYSSPEARDRIMTFALIASDIENIKSGES